MNTRGTATPIVPRIGSEKYEIILDDLEFIFSFHTLKRIEDMQNNGFNIAEISKETKRNEYEVLLAIVHLHRKGKIKRQVKVG